MKRNCLTVIVIAAAALALLVFAGTAAAQVVANPYVMKPVPHSASGPCLVRPDYSKVEEIQALIDEKVNEGDRNSLQRFFFTQEWSRRLNREIQALQQQREWAIEKANRDCQFPPVAPAPASVLTQSQIDAQAEARIQAQKPPARVVPTSTPAEVGTFLAPAPSDSPIYHYYRVTFKDGGVWLGWGPSEAAVRKPLAGRDIDNINDLEESGEKDLVRRMVAARLGQEAPAETLPLTQSQIDAPAEARIQAPKPTARIVPTSAQAEVGTPPKSPVYHYYRIVFKDGGTRLGWSTSEAGFRKLYAGLYAGREIYSISDLEQAGEEPTVRQLVAERLRREASADTRPVTQSQVGAPAVAPAPAPSPASAYVQGPVPASPPALIQYRYATAFKDGTFSFVWATSEAVVREHFATDSRGIDSIKPTGLSRVGRPGEVFGGGRL